MCSLNFQDWDVPTVEVHKLLMLCGCGQDRPIFHTSSTDQFILFQCTNVYYTHLRQKLTPHFSNECISYYRTRSHATNHQTYTIIQNIYFIFNMFLTKIHTYTCVFCVTSVYTVVNLGHYFSQFMRYSKTKCIIGWIMVW